VGTYFSDRFEVDPSALGKRGALDISLVTDLPLFIDPFLLFNSKKAEYRKLHDQVIEYLVFLRDKARWNGGIPTLLTMTVAQWTCIISGLI
jgi:hypothetical protein